MKLKMINQVRQLLYPGNFRFLKRQLNLMTLVQKLALKQELLPLEILKSKEPNLKKISQMF